LALAAAFLLCAAAPAFPRHLEKHFPVSAHPVISVHNLNGMITVKSWPKQEIMVSADHLSEKVEVDAAQTGNLIELFTHVLSENVSPIELRADYVIYAPDDAELQIHNDSGAVAVTDVLGDMTVETIGAGVQLEDTAGHLTVKTVDGSFECIRCAGRIDVRTISGNLRLLENRSSNLVVQTSTGDIFFDGDFLANGTYKLKNFSGKIEVRFASVNSFYLSATSLQGKVIDQANLKPTLHPSQKAPRYANSLFGTYNDGRAKVELSSLSGTITIRKRD
jgi:DUF4097 and DUF4098 domain-containing protein YvlB